MHETTADHWFRAFHAARRLAWEPDTRAAAADDDPRRHGRHRERGPRPGSERRAPFGFGPFGFPGPGGPFARFPFGRGPKARRGDVRAAALVLLAEGPRNGYQLMQEIETRSRGLWRPSPGSMYPVLQQLEDEGLIRPEGAGAGKVFELTETGRAYVAEHTEDLGTPWSAVAGTVGDEAADFWSLMVQVAMAARQVMHAGTARQAQEAQEVLVETRRRLYRILAEDPPPDDVEEGTIQP